jgi:hypothetical protein
LYDGGGEDGITSKRIFEVQVFFSSQNIDFPFYLRRLLELFFCFFYTLSLEHLGVLIIFEEKITSSVHKKKKKITSSKTSFQMA